MKKRELNLKIRESCDSGESYMEGKYEKNNMKN
jgi:hypothetical protein